ncbi:MAG: hypothetical protein ACO4AI_01275 [Prochlorothrix sp.]
MNQPELTRNSAPDGVPRFTGLDSAAAPATPNPSLGHFLKIWIFRGAQLFLI